MPLELKWIEPNDFFRWEEFGAAEPPEPWNCSGWFTCGIGESGSRSAMNFQFLAATRGAIAGLQQERSPRRFLAVEEFTREGIEKSVRDYLGRLSGLDWPNAEKALCKVMYSEYERPAPP